jgi:hypothetical protein
LYPNDEQKALLAQQCGSCRWLWNHFLEINKAEYEKLENLSFGMIYVAYYHI